MPPPRSLDISAEPWSEDQINPGLSHILSAPDAFHARTTVAVVDDPKFRPGNLALFMASPALVRKGWPVVDAYKSGAPPAVMQAAVDEFEAALLSVYP